MTKTKIVVDGNAFFFPFAAASHTRCFINRETVNIFLCNMPLTNNKVIGILRQNML